MNNNNNISIVVKNLRFQINKTVVLAYLKIEINYCYNYFLKKILFIILKTILTRSIDNKHDLFIYKYISFLFIK